jgi:hypothetical protein
MPRRRKGPNHHTAERTAKRDLARLRKTLHLTREFLTRCLEALTVECLILIVIRIAYVSGAVTLASIFTR